MSLAASDCTGIIFPDITSEALAKVMSIKFVNLLIQAKPKDGLGTPHDIHHVLFYPHGGSALAEIGQF